MQLRPPTATRPAPLFPSTSPSRSAPALVKEFGNRITALILNFPRVIADAYEARLDVEGFRFAGNDSGDEKLWDVWQANDLDEQSQQGHLDRSEEHTCELQTLKSNSYAVFSLTKKNYTR